jgi:hypothetical protein
MAIATGTGLSVMDRPRYLEWGPVIAGACAAAAISVLLLTFGTAVGLSVTSPWPGRGVSLTVAAWAVIWWTVLVQIASFAAGGYLAGRMRSRWGDSATEEGQFRDGAHGFMVWAIGILIGATVLAMTSGAVLRTATQSAAVVGAGAASGAAANPSLATGPTDYDVDLLLRPGPAAATPGAQPQRDDASVRAEAGRIFAASIKNQELSPRDRDYLTQLVAARTGLPQAEAQQRVDAAMNEARDLEIKARQVADQARKAAVIAAFIAAASLLISLGVACVGAGAGGKHRDEGRAPHFFGHACFW